MKRSGGTVATKREINAQIVELQKQLDNAPDDDELELLVENGKGVRTTLRGAHAKKLLKSFGIEDDEPADDDGDQDDAGEGGDGDQDDAGDRARDAKPDTDHRYFR